ncbi:MAG: DUF1836 domain-containing protein [Ruminococcaceae bacterium]|nr:DUF1836 domain-containing protein [Oscillospiraceae bacterium]MBO4972488.1 DUF1836 domain-containing protein [Clostridia bacterium]MBQ1258493.1 DUF1836 domain-containing protein [Clostridia bacterium]
MLKTLPGTTIEVSGITENTSRMLFEGIFAAGGITLSQVSVMTGLEPYMIQNWVKREFVSPPVKRQYSADQFARIVIINMLRESIQLDRICGLLSYINGRLHDESDDLISDSELYHKYVELISHTGGIVTNRESVRTAAEQVAANYVEPIPGARQRLVKILQVMAYAHYASISRSAAEEILSSLN